MVPAALAGIDIAPLLEGAAAAWETALETPDWEQDPAPPACDAACWLGAALSALAGGRAGQAHVRDLPTRCPASACGSSSWWRSPPASRAAGILPVAEEPLGEPPVYGDDRVFAHLSDAGHPQPEVQERMDALAAAGHPVITIPTHGPGDLGRVFLLAELAVAVAGWGLQINPFDQPNVQQAKDATNAVLAGFAASGELPQIAEAQPRRVRSLLLERRSRRNTSR